MEPTDNPTADRSKQGQQQGQFCRFGRPSHYKHRSDANDNAQEDGIGGSNPPCEGSHAAEKTSHTLRGWVCAFRVNSNDSLATSENKSTAVGAVPLECLKDAATLWFGAMKTILPILVLNVAFMWIVYLPAIALTPAMLRATQEVIYGKILNALRLLFFWVSICLAAISIFSFQFTRGVIVFGYAPAFVFDNVFYLSPALRDPIFVNIDNLLTLFFLGFGFYLICRCPRPDTMNEEDSVHFGLTKDGSVMGMLKGLIGFYILINFVFFNVLETYLDSPFLKQLVFRFLVFPVCFALSKWLQMKAIMHLSKEQMEKRLVVNKLCNHLIQFIGRIFISNISSKSSLSLEFVLACFSSAVMELVSVVTFEHYTLFFHRLQSRIHNLFISLFACARKTRVEPVITDVENRSGAGETDASSHGAETRKMEEQAAVNSAISFRSKYIYDDIISEVYSIFLAPLLMYLMHSLIRGSSFQYLNSFTECLYQIAIQLSFEFLADLFCLAFELHKGHVRKENLVFWSPLNPLILFFWSAFCTFWMHAIMFMRQ